MGNVPLFTREQITALSDALGDTTTGLTGSEISDLLHASKIHDVDPSLTKRFRLFNALVNDQNKRQSRTHILAFIRKSMNPARFAREPARYEPLRSSVNRALLFSGLIVDASGSIQTAKQATTLSEAEQRANDLRTGLTARGVHPDVIEFCRAELVADNYFHAVLEAVKSVADKIRNRTGLPDDGGALIDKSFGGDDPVLRINSLSSESEKSEQKGFCNLIKGTFGMFRNTTAHAAKIHWLIDKTDAEDLLSLLSLIHRRIDSAKLRT